MLRKHIIVSMVAPVAVAAILMLGVLAAISTTKQAFAVKILRSYIKTENGVNYSCKDVRSSMGYHRTFCEPIKLTPIADQQTCMRLKAKMENYEGLAQFDAAAEQYKSKDCQSILSHGTYQK